MNRAALSLYIFWSLMVIFLGFYIYSKMLNENDPNSLKSKFINFEKTINDNP